MVNKTKKKNKAKQLAAANKAQEKPAKETNEKEKNEDQGPSGVDKGGSTKPVNECNPSNPQLDCSYNSDPAMQINQPIGSNAASAEKKAKQSTETPAKETNKTKKPVQVDKSKGGSTKPMNECNQSNPQLDCSYNSDPAMQINQPIGSNAASAEKKAKQGTETPAKGTNKTKKPVQVDKSKGGSTKPMNECNRLNLQMDSSYNLDPAIPINQPIGSNAASAKKKAKQSTETPAKETNKTKKPVQVDMSRGSTVDLTNESLNLLESPYTTTNESMQIRQSTDLSNVTSGSEKKGKNDKNPTEEDSIDQPEELEQQMLSLKLTESFKTPVKEVGLLGTNQEKSDGKKTYVNQPEMSDYNTEAMESDAANLSGEFQTMKRKKFKKYGKQKVPVDQPQEPYQPLPKFSSTPAKETKNVNAGKSSNAWFPNRGDTSSESNPSTAEKKKPINYSNCFGKQTNEKLFGDQRGGEKTAPGGSNTSRWSESSRKNTAHSVNSGYQHVPCTDVKCSLIETNHVPIEFKNLPTFFYHYDVKFYSEDKRFNRRLLKEFIRIYCGDRNSAFDGARNLYSALELFPHKYKEAEIPIELRNQPVNFKVKVELVSKISTKPLQNLLCDSNYAVPIPQTITQCLNIVLGYALYLLGYKSIDEIYISDTGDTTPLMSGMVMKRGLFQSVVFGRKPFLNIYAKQKSFPAEQNVVETISQLLPRNFNPKYDFLDRTNKTRLERFLQGLRVEYTMKNDRKKTYFVTGLGPASNEANFNYNGTMITVEKYSEEERQEKLKYPSLPCLSVQNKPGAQGLPDSPIWLPPEYCRIIGGKLKKSFQDEVSAKMIELSGPPQERKLNIIGSLPHLEINRIACVQEFGISIVNKFEKIKSKILTPPMLVYDNNLTARPNDSAQWYLTKFHTDAAGAKPITWTVINVTRYTVKEHFEIFKRKMYQGCKAAGLTIENDTSRSVRVIESNIRNLQRNFENMGNYDIVFVIIADDQNNYGKIKSIAENSVGCLTQCIKLKTFKKIIDPKCNRSLTDNIAQKINAKLNGTNHILADGQLIIKWPFMIMGADVTHPTSSTGGNSIAAVTASFDKNAFQYNIYYRSQDPKMETIRDLGNMTREQLQYFRKKNPKELPSTIMFYRDGVSDGEFIKTYKEEIQAIIGACKAFQPGYQPKITFLVVQKRHNTRFFPIGVKQEAGPSKLTNNPNSYNKKPLPSFGRQVQNENIPVGTCVDTLITHPTNLTFYLLSHHTNNKKLAKPSKYVLLHDDNNFKIDVLENITYRLCYLFSRCTKPVSYPTPTYYAHLAAARIRAYSEGEEPEENELDDPNVHFKDAHPMFFV